MRLLDPTRPAETWSGKTNTESNNPLAIVKTTININDDDDDDDFDGGNNNIDDDDDDDDDDENSIV